MLHNILYNCFFTCQIQFPHLLNILINNKNDVKTRITYYTYFYVEQYTTGSNEYHVTTMVCMTSEADELSKI